MKKITLSRPTLNKLLSLAGALSLLILIFMLTDPDKVSLAVLLIPFLLIGYIAYTLTSLLLGFRHKTVAKSVATRLVPLSVSFLSVALLLLASLGQLTLRDGILVIGFTAFFLAYVARADFLK